MDYMNVIEDLRKYEGISQIEIAKILNISKSTYSNYKRYDRTMPLEHINKLANFFNISIDYIFGLSQVKNYLIINNDLNKGVIGKNIQQLRKDKKITQQKLAEIMGTTQSTISAYEKGDTLILTQFLYAICNKYKISADYLLGRIDAPKYLN